MLPIFSNVKYDRDTALAFGQNALCPGLLPRRRLHLRLTPNLGQNALCPDFYLAVQLHLRLTPEPKPKRLVPGLLPRHLPAKVKFPSVDKHIEKHSKVALKAYVLFNQPICRDGVLSSRQE